MNKRAVIIYVIQKKLASSFRTALSINKQLLFLTKKIQKIRSVIVKLVNDLDVSLFKFFWV